MKSARREQVVNRDLLTSIPSARTYQTMVGLAPGVTTSGTQDVGGLNSPATRTFAVHGGPQTEGRVMVDGMNAGGARGGAGVSNYQVDVANAQELTYTLSGGLGEAETGGPIMNVVPRTGGNKFTGSLFFSGANSAMQGSNLTDELRAAGLKDPNELIKAWEVNGAIGGPIIRDRLWFFLSAKDQGTRLYVSGMYYNKNAGNPNAWTYEPDLTRRAIYDGTWIQVPLRLTLQATPRNKFNIFWDEQSMCLECDAGSPGGGSPTVAPEASGGTWDTDFQRFHQLTWSSPITSRLLADAGYSEFRTKYGRQNADADLVSVTEQGGAIPGLVYRSGGWLRNLTDTPRWRASLSYVTGAHSMKFGYEGQFLYTNGGTYYPFPSVEYRFNNGVPNQLTMRVNPLKNNDRVRGTALYAQDQWSPVQGADLVHGPEGRGPTECDDSKRAGREPGGESGCAVGNRRANAGTPVVGQHQQRDGEPGRAADVVRRSDQSGGLPHRQGAALPPQPRAGRRRHLQRHELERAPGIYPDLRTDLAAADVRDGCALCASERPDRFLTSGFDATEVDGRRRNLFIRDVRIRHSVRVLDSRRYWRCGSRGARC